MLFLFLILYTYLSFTTLHVVVRATCMHQFLSIEHTSIYEFDCSYACRTTLERVFTASCLQHDHCVCVSLYCSVWTTTIKIVCSQRYLCARVVQCKHSADCASVRGVKEWKGERWNIARCLTELLTRVRALNMKCIRCCWLTFFSCC